MTYTHTGTLRTELLTTGSNRPVCMRVIYGIYACLVYIFGGKFTKLKNIYGELVFRSSKRSLNLHFLQASLHLQGWSVYGVIGMGEGNPVMRAAVTVVMHISDLSSGWSSV